MVAETHTHIQMRRLPYCSTFFGKFHVPSMFYIRRCIDIGSIYRGIMARFYRRKIIIFVGTLNSDVH